MQICPVGRHRHEETDSLFLRTRLKVGRNIQKAEESVGLTIRNFMNCTGLLISP